MAKVEIDEKELAQLKAQNEALRTQLSQQQAENSRLVQQVQQLGLAKAAEFMKRFEVELATFTKQMRLEAQTAVAEIKKIVSAS